MYDGKCAPVIKWAGGKTQLLKQLIPLLPSGKITHYCEPFFGGGAMLFHIQPNIIYIIDINEKLINMYKVIQSSPEALITELNEYKNTKEFYYSIRRTVRDVEQFARLSEIQKAAIFIYLNKTGFNGLYRENRYGQFNVPYGNYRNPHFVNVERIRAVSRYLNNTEVHFTSMDFEKVLKSLPSGSFVYLDPPYYPISKTANFTNYTRSGFTEEDQIRLKQCCDHLTTRDIRFMLSNSNADFIRKLYVEYDIATVSARRSINCDGKNRKGVVELVVRNYHE